MKKLHLILVLALLVLMNTMGGAFAEETSSEGFRGIKWGTDIGSLQDFSPLALSELNTRLGTSYLDVPGTEYYVRNNEKLLIGNVKILGIYYTFFHKKLFRVDVLYPGKGLGDVQKLLEKKYGNYEMKMQGPPHFHWDLGNVVIAHVPNGRNYWITYQFQKYAVEYEKGKNALSKRLEKEEQKKMEEALNDI